MVVAVFGSHRETTWRAPSNNDKPMTSTEPRGDPVTQTACGSRRGTPVPHCARPVAPEIRGSPMGSTHGVQSQRAKGWETFGHGSSCVVGLLVCWFFRHPGKQALLEVPLEQTNMNYLHKGLMQLVKQIHSQIVNFQRRSTIASPGPS